MYHFIGPKILKIATNDNLYKKSELFLIDSVDYQRCFLFALVYRENRFCKIDLEKTKKDILWLLKSFIC